jgi:hypothetical protein
MVGYCVGLNGGSCTCDAERSGAPGGGTRRTGHSRGHGAPWPRSGVHGGRLHAALLPTVSMWMRWLWNGSMLCTTWGGCGESCLKGGE